jgi:hypothetical protein
VHDANIRELLKTGKGSVSLVDQISFPVMERRNLTTAFDPHFKAAGFRLFEPRHDFRVSISVKIDFIIIVVRASRFVPA